MPHMGVYEEAIVDFTLLAESLDWPARKIGAARPVLLIGQAVIAFAGESGIGHEAEHAESILDGDDDHAVQVNA
jgi:hypothetical protein